jgi:hypothetical protein
MCLGSSSLFGIVNDTKIVKKHKCVVVAFPPQPHKMQPLESYYFQDQVSVLVTAG